MTVVFVSPHLDDAVLSCSGAIRRHVVRGERVVVVTVFSEGSDRARRRAEDIAAVGTLGAEAMHLGLRDAPERLGIACTHRALVEEAVPRRADVDTVAAALDAVVHTACIYAPLGVGGHVDHRVVHEALRNRPDVVLYEDRPYSFLAGAVRARIAALGLRAGALEDAGAPDPALVRDQLETLPHLRAYLADDDGGARARAWLSTELHAAVTASPRDLAPSVAEYDEETASVAARAICLYGSQLGALFGGPQGVAPALRAAARALGAASSPHAERTFTFPPR